MNQPIQPPVLADLDAEKATLSALLNEQVAIESIDLQASEFHTAYHQSLYETMTELWATGCPLTVGLIHHELVTKKKLAQCKPPDGVTVKDYLTSLKAADVNPDHITHYAGIVKKLARVRSIVELNAKVIRAAYDDPDPDKLDAMITEGIMQVAGGRKSNVITWQESLDRYEAILDERAAQASLPADQQKIFDFVWSQWNDHIMPLTPGTIMLFAAPSNVGKSIYAEGIAEHWARRGINVAFFHLELDEEDMGDRRTARWSGIYRPQLQGKVSAYDRNHIRETSATLKTWRGGVHYVHCPGWTADDIVREIRAMQAAGLCDAFVIDYHQKVQGSDQQWRRLKDQYKIEADNMEKFKIVAEKLKLRGVVFSQMTKDAGNLDIEELTGSKVRGAGELLERSNIGILAARKRGEDGTHGNVVDIKIEKNKGPKLVFQQNINGGLYTILPDRVES